MRFEASLETILQAALTEALGTLAARPAEPRRIAVAYSGGGDSTALLHASAMLQRRRLIEVFAFHVHHGLADDADQWLAHCADRAAALGVAFDADHVAPARGGPSAHGGLEADARRLRYAALVRLCRKYDCDALLTAHHADDQAETVLLNLARGAGIGGLAAAAKSRLVDGVPLVRPFLDVPAARLDAYRTSLSLSHVDDRSNADRRFTRNAIRHEVMPALRRIVPSIATRLAQTASHAATMQALLDEIGLEDLAPDAPRDGSADAVPDDALDVERLASLSSARAANALRVWLARRGLRPPSAAALKEMLAQLLHASPDAQIELLHERQTLRAYRGRLSIDRGGPPRPVFKSLVWRGEATIDVPEWNGALRFTPTDAGGFDAAALREGPLALRERRGGERLRMRVDGPSRTLKNLYQEAGIAAWQRGRLPLVYLGDRLLFAAGLGANAATLVDPLPGTDLVALAWQPG